MGGAYSLGSIALNNQTSPAEITGSSAAGNVSGTFAVGGLVGLNEYGTIDASRAGGDVSGLPPSAFIGGLVGSNSSGLVKNSRSSGDVEGWENVGGLVGANTGFLMCDLMTETTLPGNHTAAAQIPNGAAVPRITGSSAAGNVRGWIRIGGLAGLNEWGHISGSYATGDVDSYGNNAVGFEAGAAGILAEAIGGLVGENREGSISKSRAAGNVSGYHDVGGLVGKNIAGSVNLFNSGTTGRFGALTEVLDPPEPEAIIERSYATGSVQGAVAVGGLVGSHIGEAFMVYTLDYEPEFNAMIVNTYARGDVSGNFAVGGLVGNNDALIRDSYSTGRVSPPDLVNTDSLNSNNCGAYGGLVGWSEGGLGSAPWCFWDVDTDGLDTSGGDDNYGATGKTTPEMKNRSTFTDAGWNFTNVWSIGTLNDGYPFFIWQRAGSGGGGAPDPGPDPDPDPDRPGAPMGLSGTYGDLSVLLSWLPGSGSIFWYHVYVSRTGGAAGILAGETDGLKFNFLAQVSSLEDLQYLHTGLTRGLTYYYLVVSAGEDGTESSETSLVFWVDTATGETGTFDPLEWGPDRIIRDDEDGDSSLCFIATAVYGSAHAGEVASFRKFRDSYLLTSRAGRVLVEAYYALSPALADAVAENRLLRFAARMHLAPLARWVEKLDMNR